MTEPLKRYLFAASVESASGSQTFYIDAPTLEIAEQKAKEGNVDDLYCSECEVTSLGAFEHTGEVTTIDDFGDYGADKSEMEARACVSLTDMNADLLFILGRPCFQCADIAQILRLTGENIPRRAENEQAATLHWMLGFYLKHGDNWKAVANADLQRRQDLFKAKQAEKKADDQREVLESETIDEWGWGAGESPSEIYKRMEGPISDVINIGLHWDIDSITLAHLTSNLKFENTEWVVNTTENVNNSNPFPHIVKYVSDYIKSLDAPAQIILNAVGINNELAWRLVAEGIKVKTLRTDDKPEDPADEVRFINKRAMCFQALPKDPRAYAPHFGDFDLSDIFSVSHAGRWVALRAQTLKETFPQHFMKIEAMAIAMGAPYAKEVDENV